MATGKTNASGSFLNISVKRYETEELLKAATPKFNTVGVISDINITSFAARSSEPTNPEEGMFWLMVSGSSVVDVNLQKKNAIYIYPVNGFQYVSGSWVNVPTMIYQDEWIGLWDGKIFWLGKDYKEFTGGIIADNSLQYTENEKSFTVRTVGHSEYLKAHVDNVDLTTYDTMKINITDISFNYANSAGNTTASLHVVQNGAVVKSIGNIQTTGAKEYSIDVSDIKGKADLCVVLYCYAANSSVYISVTADKWWLERNQTNVSTTELDEAFQNGVNSI
jgi:hypothetical protein